MKKLLNAQLQAKVIGGGEKPAKKKLPPKYGKGQCW